MDAVRAVVIGSLLAAAACATAIVAIPPARVPDDLAIYHRQREIGPLPAGCSLLALACYEHIQPGGREALIVNANGSYALSVATGSYVEGWLTRDRALELAAAMRVARLERVRACAADAWADRRALEDAVRAVRLDGCSVADDPTEAAIALLEQTISALRAEAHI